MNNLLVNEKKAIHYWTSPSKFRLYREIKKACENKYSNATHDVEQSFIDCFNSLEHLFTKYEDNTASHKAIYRADIIENKYSKELSDDGLFLQFCNDHSKDEIFKFDDMICSFSSCHAQANKIATKNDKYKNERTPRVLFILENRISKYLYIADYSQLPEEKEILTFGKNSFKVVNQEVFENNYVEISIVEIENKGIG
jgi:hypothetical protein